METKKGILFLDQNDIQNKITRIAYQILEDSFGENELVLAGIADRGYILASRLRDELKTIAPDLNVLLIRITINKESSNLQAETDVPAAQAANRVVVLIDDVLNSGRAISYGLGVFLNVALKKLRTAVLVDRSHRKFPVEGDFVGMKLSTVLNEHVAIALLETDGEDAAYLL